MRANVDTRHDLVVDAVLQVADIQAQVEAAQAAAAAGAGPRLLATCSARDILRALESSSASSHDGFVAVAREAVRVTPRGENRLRTYELDLGWVVRPPWSRVVVAVREAAGGVAVYLVPASHLTTTDLGYCAADYVGVRSRASDVSPDLCAGHLPAARLPALRDRTLLRLAGYLTGLAERAVALAVDRALSRRQFDRAIAANQAIAFALARTCAETAAVAAMLRRCGAPNATGFPPASAIAALAAENARAATACALHVGGAHGLTGDSDAQLCYARAAAHSRMLGDPAALRAEALARAERRWLPSHGSEEHGDGHVD